ncbi:MAG: WPE palindromic element domain-containing protein [Wolbachia sp.]
MPRHWDPENFTLNEHTRWLYNRNWIPVSRTGMTPICSYSCLFSSTLFCHPAEQIH